MGEASATGVNTAFAAEIRKRSGIDLRKCYQCGKCTAGCPMTFMMDTPPSRAIRMAQLGMREDVLTSRTIWVCVSCETCTTRCPKEVDIAGFMDVMREMSLEAGLASLAEEDIQQFHQAFLESVEGSGRFHELTAIRKYKLRTLHFFEDIELAPAFLLKGKMSIFPRKIAGVKAVRKLFEICRRRPPEEGKK